MKYQLRKLILLLSFLFLGCSNAPVHEEISSILPPMSEGEYSQVIIKYTQKDEKYSGFYNDYIISVTMLNSKVQNALLQRMGHYLQWDTATARKQRDKTFQEMSNETQFILSFYSPEKDHDDLHLKTSMWKFYLESNGVRYLGKLKKKKMKLSQLKKFFPHHRRFNSAYELSFKVPMTAIEVSQAKLTMTSSLGQSEFQFEQ